ncbi:hypothetical protein BSKO_05342 [Bryopsis sp. KO-2023]|nr:hypothetical protein BSKO_05342 [Bryopsis sp. KO-2023]
MSLDERQINLLKRKLEAFGYSQPLDSKSASLVKSLVDDLVHATESYRAIKLQGTKQGQEIENFNSQIQVLKKDSGRLVAENNDLHLELIRATEKFETREREHYQEIKKLENQITELAYWKAQTVEGFRAKESENSRLKEKLKDVLNLGASLKKGGVDIIDDGPKLTMSNALGHSTHVQPPKHDPKSVDIMKTANNRIARLEEQIAKFSSENERLMQKHEECKVAADRKDEEIKRLGKELAKGQDLEKLDLKYRNDANENVIISLNQQVDYLASQNSTLTSELEDKGKTEAALAECEKSRTDAENRLEEALREKVNVVNQVQDLQRGLTNLRAGRSKAGKAVAEERDGALGEVAKLMGRLTAEQSGSENLKSMLEATESEKARAQQIHEKLRKELQSMSDLLQHERESKDSLHSQVASLNLELAETRTQLEKSCESLESCQQKLLHMEGRRVESLESIRALQEEKELIATKMEGAQNRLEEMKAAAAQGRTTVVALEAKESKSASEVKRLESNLAAAESELQVLRDRSRDLSDQRMRVTNDLQAADDDRQRFSQDLKLVQSQLKEERIRNEDLITHRDKLEMEVGRLQSQVTMLHNEKQFLSENWEASNVRIKEGQQKLGATSRELAQLQNFPQKVEELQNQLKDLSEKLIDAETKVSDMRAENVRLTEALHLSKADVDGLRRTLDEAECERNQLRLKLEETEQQMCSIVTSIKALEAERDRERKNRESAEAELSDLRGNLEDRSIRAKDSEFTARSLEQKLRSTQQELAIQTDEVDRLQGLLNSAHQCTDAVRQQHEESRNQSNEISARMHRAEAMNEEYEAELSQLRAHQDMERARLQNLDETTSRLRSENDAKRKEVDQLTTLTLKGDATVQEYMKNMKTVGASLRAAEVHIKELESEVAGHEVAEVKSQEQIEDLKSALHALDQDRDRLQDELDSKDEEIAHMKDEMDLGREQLDEVKKLVASTETQLSRAAQRIEDLEEEVVILQEKNQKTHTSLKSVQSEAAALKDEYRAVSNDLEVMVQENQVLSQQLMLSGSNREGVQQELKDSQSRIVQAEQKIRMKETELEDIRHAYEELALENRRIQSSLSQVERDSAARDAHLNSKGTEVSALQDAQRAAQSQINEYLVDLQAFEKQVDQLSRDLANKEEDLEESSRERESLLEQVRAAELVRFDLETNQENFRRQLAGMDGQMEILKTRLQDSSTEITNLKRNIQVKTSKIKELEALMLQMRNREFKAESDSRSSGGRAQILEEKTRLLEEQVDGLQHEVQTAEEARSMAEEELNRLRVEMAAIQEPSSPLVSAFKNQSQSLQVEKEYLDQEVSRLRRELEFRSSSAQEPFSGPLADSQDSVTEMKEEVSALRRQVQEQDSLLSESGTSTKELHNQNQQLHNSLVELEAERQHLWRENCHLHAEVQSLQVTLGWGGASASIASSSPRPPVSSTWEGSLVSTSHGQSEAKVAGHGKVDFSRLMGTGTGTGTSTSLSTPSRRTGPDTTLETLVSSRRVADDVECVLPPRGLGGGGLGKQTEGLRNRTEVPKT